MKKYLIIPLIALLFIGLVFSSGCLKKSEAKETPRGLFAGGAEGLELSFLPGLPPDEVFELTPFTISVKLENKGEYNVDPGVEVRIGGIPTKAFNIDPANQSTTGNLSGAKLIAGEALPGGFEIFEFPAKAPDYPGDTEVTIVASTCYDYESLGVVTACIRENLFIQATSAPEICTISGEKEIFNRGAPIQVTSVKEIPMGEHKLGFQIKVRNNGGGQVYLPGSDCRTSKDANKVRIDSVVIRGLEFDCTPSDVLTLVDGEGLALCSADLPEEIEGEYEDIVEITLNYSYADQITKKVTIIHVPGAVAPEEEPAEEAEEEQPEEAVCLDSDGGDKPEVQGTTRIQGTTETFTDFCSENMLTEYYCENNEIKQKGYNCPGVITNSVCRQGVCVVS